MDAEEDWTEDKLEELRQNRLRFLETAYILNGSPLPKARSQAATTITHLAESTQTLTQTERSTKTIGQTVVRRPQTLEIGDSLGTKSFTM
jgi:hypothetical protein